MLFIKIVFIVSLLASCSRIGANAQKEDSVNTMIAIGDAIINCICIYILFNQ